MTGALVEEFCSRLVRGRGRSPRTADSYRDDLEHFQRFGGADLLSADRDRVRAFVAWMHDQGQAAATLRRRVAGLRAFYRHQVLQGRMAVNPALSIVLPRWRRKAPDVLYKDAMRELLSRLPPATDFRSARDRALVELLYGGGLRVDEVRTLCLDRLNLHDRMARVVGKGNKVRFVPLTARSAEALEAWLPYREAFLKTVRGGASEGHLFVSRFGRGMTTRAFQQSLENIGKRAGFSQRLHPHLFRHSYATHLLQGGAGLRDVQELLGHASIATTQIYTHLTRDDLRIELAKHPLAPNAGPTSAPEDPQIAGKGDGPGRVRLARAGASRAPGKSPVRPAAGRPSNPDRSPHET
ncbi:MAG: tyrosine-type recombinase/integrase [Spirochaetes bacterium]|nr:tyrosine-type recombinase/integrase [Spirochaetota bacterium]